MRSLDKFSLSVSTIKNLKFATSFFLLYALLLYSLLGKLYISSFSNLSLLLSWECVKNFHILRGKLCRNKWRFSCVFSLLHVIHNSTPTPNPRILISLQFSYSFHRHLNLCVEKKKFNNKHTTHLKKQSKNNENDEISFFYFIPFQTIARFTIT